MKQVLFFYLVITLLSSCDNLAKSNISIEDKLAELGLEVMPEDLGRMTWDDANRACRELGNSPVGNVWRLPTRDELQKIKNIKDEIGGFKRECYWSSTVTSEGFPVFWNLGNGYQVSHPSLNKRDMCYVRLVRDLY
jgi:hypothetical protein